MYEGEKCSLHVSAGNEAFRLVHAECGLTVPEMDANNPVHPALSTVNIRNPVGCTSGP